MPSVQEWLKNMSKQDVLMGLVHLMSENESPRYGLVHLSLDVRSSLQVALAVLKRVPEDTLEKVLQGIEEPDYMPTDDEIVEAIEASYKVDPFFGDRANPSPV